MDIAAISIGMADMNKSLSVGVSMMKKAIEQTEQVGEQLAEMMASVTETGKIDISV